MVASPSDVEWICGSDLGQWVMVLTISSRYYADPQAVDEPSVAWSLLGRTDLTWMGVRCGV